MRNASYGRGELLRYKIHYGIINAAEGELETAGDLHHVNGRPCYKVTVTGRTTGSFDFFLRIRDTWRSYIDTASLLPQKFVRDIAESKYRKKESMDFDHPSHTVLVEDHREKKKQTFQVPRKHSGPGERHLLHAYPRFQQPQARRADQDQGLLRQRGGSTLR